MEDHDDELLTIADAAKRANLTIPRLRRILAKPQWKKHVQIVERETKTGTRPTSVVPVSVISAILSTKSDQEQNENALNLVPVSQKTIADKDSEIEYLRGALRIAQESLLREQQAHAETRRFLAPPQPRTETIQPKERSSSEPKEAEEKPVTEAPKKGFFARLFGG